MRLVAARIGLGQGRHHSQNAESSRMPFEFSTGVTLPEYFSTMLDTMDAKCDYERKHIWDELSRAGAVNLLTVFCCSFRTELVGANDFGPPSFFNIQQAPRLIAGRADGLQTALDEIRAEIGACEDGGHALR